MPKFKRIGGGPWKNVQKSVDLTWNDPKAKSLTLPPLSIGRYSYIQLTEQGRQWRERKCLIFEKITKRDSNPGSLDCESGILPLSYRAPQFSVSPAGGRAAGSLPSLVLTLDGPVPSGLVALCPRRLTTLIRGPRAATSVTEQQLNFVL